MRYHDSIFACLLKPISRRQFKTIVERHDGDAYDKTFDSWDHLVVLMFAQLSGASGLRGLETSWNAHAHHHYHLGAGPIARSTLSDANLRRPLEVFAETFAMLSAQADRHLRREGAEMLRLIDASPIRLEELCTWARWNGRTRGLKLHVVFDPHADHPRRVDITPANVNDVEVGHALPIETDATYVFDKGYCDYAWWTRIHDAGAHFVTRPKTNAPYRLVRHRRLRKKIGDGFKVIDDADVVLDTQGKRKLAIPMRRVRVEREDGTVLTIISNDRRRSAVEIATLYKTRWQIELLFRWIKQHLKIRSFLGRNDNAIRLQIVAAMIAYVLLRIAARETRITMPVIRFADLLKERLFTRRTIAQIDKPPDVHLSKARPKVPTNQLELQYA